jgi:hypothetical protein
MAMHGYRPHLDSCVSCACAADGRPDSRSRREGCSVRHAAEPLLSSAIRGREMLSWLLASTMEEIARSRSARARRSPRLRAHAAVRCVPSARAPEGARVLRERQRGVRDRIPVHSRRCCPGAPPPLSLRRDADRARLPGRAAAPGCVAPQVRAALHSAWQRCSRTAPGCARRPSALRRRTGDTDRVLGLPGVGLGLTESRSLYVRSSTNSPVPPSLLLGGG